MYLLKFQLDNNSEPNSLFVCLSSEVRNFNHKIEIIKLEHPDERFYIASKNDVCEFENADELIKRCEFIELSDQDYQTLSKLRLGNGDCMAQNIFDSVCNDDVVFEPKQIMEMGM